MNCPLKLPKYFSTLNPDKHSQVPRKTFIQSTLSSSYRSPQPKIHATKSIEGSSYSQKSNNTVTSAAAVSETKKPKYKQTSVYKVVFKTLGGCKLGIGRYPDFVYNAAGGIGIGNGSVVNSDGDISVCFDLEQLYIPAMTSSTTKFLGLPLPPLLKIDIVPEIFHGNINKVSGKLFSPHAEQHNSIGVSSIVQLHWKSTLKLTIPPTVLNSNISPRPGRYAYSLRLPIPESATSLLIPFLLQISIVVYLCLSPLLPDQLTSWPNVTYQSSLR